MLDRARYLLLQVRDPDDPMAGHEVDCFAGVLGCPVDRISVQDLLTEPVEPAKLVAIDVVLLGGSGDYSVVGDEPWLDRALDGMRELHAASKPTFASCWGFQAMARAMGGSVIHDAAHAEVGTYEVRLTEAGAADPVFRDVGDPFPAQIGHEDTVIELPANATRLASTRLVENHAYRFDGKPIYCTQFHPELTRETLLDRLKRYPKYVEQITSLPYEEFVRTRVAESPTVGTLLTRFVEETLA